MNQTAPHSLNTRLGKQKQPHNRHARHGALLRSIRRRRGRRANKRALQERWAR